MEDQDYCEMGPYRMERCRQALFRLETQGPDGEEPHRLLHCPSRHGEWADACSPGSGFRGDCQSTASLSTAIRGLGLPCQLPDHFQNVSGIHPPRRAVEIDKLRRLTPGIPLLALSVEDEHRRLGESVRVASDLDHGVPLALGYVESPCQPMIRVREETEREVVLCGKLPVDLRTIGRDAYDPGFARLKRPFDLLEPLPVALTVRSPVPTEEHEDGERRLCEQLLHVYRLAGLVLQR